MLLLTDVGGCAGRAYRWGGAAGFYEWTDIPGLPQVSDWAQVPLVLEHQVRTLHWAQVPLVLEHQVRTLY